MDEHSSFKKRICERFGFKGDVSDEEAEAHIASVTTVLVETMREVHGTMDAVREALGETADTHHSRLPDLVRARLG